MNGNKRRDRRDGKIIGFFKDVFRRDCHWNYLRDCREFYRNGDSMAVRNTVRRVEITAITMGRMICNKTNCRLNHCLLSTSATPS